MPSIPPRACVGRDDDVRRIARLFSDGERLVTIVGGGGIGKTTLAAHVPQDGEPFVLCELAEARDEGALHDATARALELSQAIDPASAAERLGRAIAARGRTLFVLDNVEQIVEVVARSLAQWLALAPEARFLVTSREPLGLRDEVRYELGPLALPGAPGDLESCDAGRLLLARIRRARRDFSIEPADRPLALELLRRIDAIPLAIELAAPRVAALGLAPVVERLRGRALDALGTGPRDAGARHATLRATIEWSWDLLAPHEQAALAQCAVFRGGLTLDAAEHVLDLSEHSGAPPIADVVQMLREKSLLLARRTEDGEDRFAPYFGVREIAEERLDERAMGAVRARHAAYYVARGEERARRVHQPGGPAALRALRAERDNLLAAASWPGDPALAARALLALWPVAQLDFAFQSFSPPLEAALVAVTDDALRAAMLAVRAEIGWRTSAYAESARDVEVASAIARARGDDRLLAKLRLASVYISYRQAAVLEARSAAYEAIELAARAGDAKVELDALTILAGILQDEGDQEEALQASSRACAVAERAGNVPGAVGALVSSGVLQIQCGELGGARARLERALALNAEIGYRPLGAFVLGWLGLVDALDGHLESARSRLVEAAAVLASLGRPEYAGFFRAWLALVLSELGCAAEAREQVAASELLFDRSSADFGARPLPAAVRVLLDARDGRIDAARAGMVRARGVPTSLRAWKDALDVWEGHLDLAEAQAIRTRGDEGAAARHVERARARLRHASERDPTRVRLSAWESLDVRLACSVLEIAVAAQPGPARPGAEAALVVHERGDWFELPPGVRVDCRTRQAPRRLLAHLAQVRAASPGVAVPLDALVMAGWPGESAAWEASLNRLRVAVNVLRRLGLGDHLRNERGGYLLDPDLAIRIERA
jgi:predicted ATPase